MAFNFQWKEEYSVGVAEIDQQHQKLIKTISNLNDAIGKNSLKQEMEGILFDLEQYVESHFSTEEKYFEQFAYENKAEHVSEHRKFENKIAEFKAKYLNKETEISFELIDFLEDWLLDHMLNSDRKYIECFAKNGLK